jgi:hypothetical protein
MITVYEKKKIAINNNAAFAEHKTKSIIHILFSIPFNSVCHLFEKKKQQQQKTNPPPMFIEHNTRLLPHQLLM